MKKVLIIGGGVSGLAAGIYLQANGYETEIIEKNGVLGGACIAWERKGCYIDGCIHWLTGVNPKGKLNKLWRDTGALDDQTEIYYQDDLAVFDYGNGIRFTFWADVDKLEKELLAFAPEDTKEILNLCKMIRRFKRIDPPAKKPADLMNLGELLEVAFTMAGDYYWVNKTSKLSCVEYANRFKNPYIRKAISDYMPSGYNLMSFLYMFGHIANMDAGIPIGGSSSVIDRMRKKYESLGGKFRVGIEVKNVIIEENVAKGVLTKKGEEIFADYVISTTPIEHCLKDLLEDKYKLKSIDMRLKNMAVYPIYTYTCVVIKCSEDLSSKPLSITVPATEPVMLDRAYDSISIRNYSYDKTTKMPENTTILQATIISDDSMYFWWKNAKENGSYKEEKQRVAGKLLEIVKKTYPDLDGKLEVIDVVTPCTYERYLNSRHGSFQGFVHTNRGKALNQKGEIKGLKNFYLAGQCLIQSGGLPPAVMSGRFAAQRICKNDKKRFVEPTK